MVIFAIGRTPRTEIVLQAVRQSLMTGTLLAPRGCGPDAIDRVRPPEPLIAPPRRSHSSTFSSRRFLGSEVHNASPRAYKLVASARATAASSPMLLIRKAKVAGVRSTGRLVDRNPREAITRAATTRARFWAYGLL
jgi:hypothetical protein